MGAKQLVMKKICSLSFAALVAVLFVSAQSRIDQAPPFDSTKKSAPKKKGIAFVFFEHQVYAPASFNRFKMTYRISSGATVLLPIKGKLSFFIGARMWTQTTESYFFKSRSWAQYGYHAAFGPLWTEQLGKRSRLSIGPVLAKLSYTPSGVPAWYDNKAYGNLVRSVEDSAVGIRGIYYTSPYLFVLFQRRTTAGRTFEAELNALLPGLPSALQRRETLIHMLRGRVFVERGRWSAKGDIGIPALSLADAHTVRYRDMRLREITGKIEAGYSIPLQKGKLKVLLGFERDWHAYNFPEVLQTKKLNGSWSAFYSGIQVGF